MAVYLLRCSYTAAFAGPRSPAAADISLSPIDSNYLLMYKKIMSLSSPRYDPQQGLYAISVVTELTGIGAQTLRGYERAGLVTPARTEGGTRRYSDHDLARLRRILTLVGEGINLTGVGRILQLEAELAALRAHIAAESPADPS
jgi:hypothetical protein